MLLPCKAPFESVPLEDLGHLTNVDTRLNTMTVHALIDLFIHVHTNMSLRLQAVAMRTRMTLMLV